MDPWRRAQYCPQRPSYPQMPSHSPATSTPSSVFQSSSSSLASVASFNAASTTVSPFSAMSSRSAPLPSPSAGGPSTYFGAAAAATSSPHSSQSGLQSSQQRMPQLQSTNAKQTYVGQKGGSGGIPETASFLQDFNLVAEAAKRAQMACLARDLGDVSL